MDDWAAAETTSTNSILDVFHGGGVGGLPVQLASDLVMCGMPKNLELSVDADALVETIKSNSSNQFLPLVSNSAQL